MGDSRATLETGNRAMNENIKGRHSKEYMEAMSRTLALARDHVRDSSITDVEIASTFKGTTLTIAADANNLDSFAAQTAMVTLFLLVARLGCAVRLVMPPVRLLGDQPPLRGEDLREALLDIGRDLIPECEAVLDSTPSDLTFVL